MPKKTGSDTKWYFVKEGDKVRIFRKKSPLKKSDGEEYGGVVNIGVSKSDAENDKLKIACDNDLKGIGLRVSFFDFTENEFSQQFKSCYSANTFVERFNEIVLPDGSQLEEPSLELESQGEEVPSMSSADGLNRLADETVLKRPNNRKRTSATNDTSESPPVPKKVTTAASLSETSKANKKDTTSTDDAFLREVSRFAVPGVHRVLATSLVAPRPEYRLRDIDSCHLAALKQELLSRPMSSGKTMLVVARGLKEAKNFDEKDLDSYALEVIGGNHRREVILQIMADDSTQSKDCFKFVYVQIYTEMETVAVLRLAQIHNQADRVYHEMNSKEKVVLCRQLLDRNFNGKKCLEWKKTCATVIGEDVQKMETVFFVSAFKEEIYKKVLTAMERYGRLELKGQRASVKQLNDRRQDKAVDCPIYNFKCLRGDLTESEIIGLMTDVVEGTTTFAEMKEESRRLKEVKEVQRRFISETASKNWEEVEQRFTVWVEEHKLQAFRGQAKNSSLKGYIAQALQWEDDKCRGGTSTSSSNELQLPGPRGTTTSIVVSSIDAWKLNNASLTDEAHRFMGSPLVFINLPKDWDENHFDKLLRSIKSINGRHNVEIFHLVAFPHVEKIIESMEFLSKTPRIIGYDVELAYLYSSTDTKGHVDNNRLRQRVVPFSICHWGKCSHKTQSSNVFQFNTTVTAKPVELYKTLLTLYGYPGTWVLDLCSNTGSAAVACAENGEFNCIVAETDATKLRSILRKVVQIQEKE